MASFTQAIYNARAPTYDESWHPLQAADFIRWSEPRPGQHVLDLACGTGLVTIPAKEAVGSTGTVTGIDVADGMLQMAREKAKRKGLEIEFWQHDITRLGELDLRRDYDIITCASALALLTDPGTAIKHWVTFLRSGGLLVVDALTEKMHMPGLVFEDVAEEMHIELPYTRRWIRGPDSLADLVRDAGLQVIQNFTAKGYRSGNTYARGDAERVFDEMSGSPFFSRFREEDVRGAARSLFAEKWQERAAPDGVMREEDSFYMVIGKKP